MVDIGGKIRYKNDYDDEEFKMFNNIFERQKARQIFLNIIGEMMPECWEELYEGMGYYEEFLTITGAEEFGYGSDIFPESNVVFKHNKEKDFYNFIMDWLEEYSLDEDWIRDLLLQLFKCWKISKHEKVGQFLQYHNPRRVVLINEVIKIIDNETEDFKYPDTLVFKLSPTYILPPELIKNKIIVEWDVINETKSEFRKKVERETKKLINEVESSKEEAEMEKGKSKNYKRDQNKKIPESDLRHFKWFIKFQMKKISKHQLAKNMNKKGILATKSRSSIIEGIKDVAQLLDIEQREVQN